MTQVAHIPIFLTLYSSPPSSTSLRRLNFSLFISPLVTDYCLTLPSFYTSFSIQHTLSLSCFSPSQSFYYHVSLVFSILCRFLPIFSHRNIQKWWWHERTWHNLIIFLFLSIRRYCYYYLQCNKRCDFIFIKFQPKRSIQMGPILMKSWSDSITREPPSGPCYWSSRRPWRHVGKRYR